MLSRSTSSASGPWDSIEISENSAKDTHIVQLSVHMLITLISKKSDIVQKMCIIWELTQNRKRFFKGKSTSGPLQVLKDTSDQIQESEN